MALKIKIEVVNGEARVNPDTMKLLLGFGGHRKVCESCDAVCKTGSGFYCVTGQNLLLEILERPDVEWVPE
jgi:hypothetical protein